MKQVAAIILLLVSALAYPFTASAQIPPLSPEQIQAAIKEGLDGFAPHLNMDNWYAWVLAYKVIVTLDAPVHFLSKGLQYLWRRLCGRKEKAEKSLVAMRGLGHFLAKGLLPFWQA